MQIAIPTDDGVAVAEHFGRSAGFLVFDVEEGKIQMQTLRPNAGQHTPVGATGCQHGAEGGAGHDHGTIVASIAGCEVVICAGMGGRAASALKASGVKEIVMTEPGLAADVVNAYLAGTLTTRSAGFCHCSH